MQKKGQKRALGESETFKTPEVLSIDNPTKNKKAKKANAENNKIVPKKAEQTVAKKNDAKAAENKPAAGKGHSEKKKDFTVEEIKERVTNILSRGELSKRAKRKLATFKKLLQLKGCDIKDIKVDEKSKQNANEQNSNTKKKAVEKGAVAQKVNQVIANKPGQQNKNKKPEKEPENKEKAKVQKQKNLVQIKKEPEHEEDSEEDDSDDEEEEEVEIAKPPKKLMSLTQGDSDDDDEDEEDDEDDDDDDEDEGVENGKSDISMEQDSDDDDDEDDDEDEEDEDEEAEGKVLTPKSTEVKKQGKKPEQAKDSGDSSKKKRYVLFVGNIPYDAGVEDLKKHFLTKVSDVASVRIPTKPGTNTARGFAYVEVSNNIDFEKGLSLHNSFLNGRKIKVEYTSPGSKNISNKKDVIVKNKKLQALRKAGKLAGSQNDNQKRNVRRMKQKQGNKKPE